MYRYDTFDQQLVEQRCAEFRDQVARRLRGELTEEEFKPLRLKNGLYLQLHAYMLRVAVPYGVLSANQLHKLADIADKYDRGYGHFTTRQNIQFNWPQLVDMPDILDELASVQMHAIQTSGNCIRNVTTDPFAGVAADEVVDPRPVCEWLRQWSTLMPEFSWLPRKFKIAVTGSTIDRVAIKLHDIGIQLKTDDNGATVADIWVGGGQGRTPRIAQLLKSGVNTTDLLPYLDAIMRVYNLHGNRKKKYMARIKILLADLGLAEFSRQVQQAFEHADREIYDHAVDELRRIESHFAVTDATVALPMTRSAQPADSAFDQWVHNNTFAHRSADRAIVVISLKPAGGIPGDATSAQMRSVAELAANYSQDELRVTHRQNLVLPHVARADLYAVWQKLVAANLASANVDQASDIISCPGMDYCSLAKARSIPLAKTLSSQLSKREAGQPLSGISVNISGCINACGHHHVAAIGVLGLEKQGSESYQITLGGRNDMQAAVCKVLGPGFSAEQLPQAIDNLVDTWQTHRNDDESFADTFERIGKEPFKERVYASA